jgi:hypothetical protein
MVQEITRYVARRLVERERALAGTIGPEGAESVMRATRRRRRWETIRAFVLGLVLGVAALFVLALLNTP